MFAMYIALPANCSRGKHSDMLHGHGDASEFWKAILQCHCLVRAGVRRGGWRSLLHWTERCMLRMVEPTLVVEEGMVSKS
jgi:hypothetical protein